MLHDCEELEDPEQDPPLYGPYFDLDRYLVPEPHVFEQDPHDPQPPQEQGAENNDFYFLLQQ